VQRLAAGHENDKLWAQRQELRDERSCAEDLLEIVEDEEGRCLAEDLRNDGLDGFAAGLLNTHNLRDRCRYGSRGLDGGEIDEEDAVAVVVGGGGGRGGGETGFAGTAGARKGQQSDAFG
jgi:hypothetical protein